MCIRDRVCGISPCRGRVANAANTGSSAADICLSLIHICGSYEQQLADAYKRIGNPYPPFVGKGDLFKAISEYAMEQHFPLWIAIHGDNEVGDFGTVLETNDDMIVITRLDDQNNENRSYISKQAINYIECEYKGNELSKTL